MSKYDALGEFLRKQGRDRVPVTFSEIEKIIGGALPKSQQYPAWWSNNPSNNVMTQVWLDAGYRTEQVDIVGRRLVFVRERRGAVRPAGGNSPGEGVRASGMSDAARSFEQEGMMKKARHPAWGAMKGTFTIAPGTDLTQPALDPEELAEWEASLERKASLIDRVLRRKKG